VNSGVIGIRNLSPCSTGGRKDLHIAPFSALSHCACHFLSHSSYTLEATVDIGILSYTKFLSSSSWPASFNFPMTFKVPTAVLLQFQVTWDATLSHWYIVTNVSKNRSAFLTPVTLYPTTQRHTPDDANRHPLQSAAIRKCAVENADSLSG